LWVVVLAAALMGGSSIADAQQSSKEQGNVGVAALTAESGLPDAPQPHDDSAAPGAASSSSISVLSTAQTQAPTKDTGPTSVGEILKGSKEAAPERTLVAPVYHRYIRPDEIAQTLTPRQRLILGFHQPLSPFFLLTIVSAAGYEQAVNGSPNYGSNFPAFGQRLGAAAIRNASQSIFADSLMAPLLHEDPRYYIMGDRHNAVVRTAYAISRVLVTRKDEGGATANYALFAGYAGAAGLTNAYYPAVNVGFRPTARSFEGSLIGVGLGNIVREFLPDLLHATHLERFD
jgi:hypothetical protein